MDHATADLIEQTSEATARRIVDPLWKEIRVLSTSMARVEAHAAEAESGRRALLGEVDGIKKHCSIKHQDVDTTFNLLRAQVKEPEVTVSKWKERAIGAGAVIGSCGGLVVLVRLMVEGFKK